MLPFTILLCDYLPYFSEIAGIEQVRDYCRIIEKLLEWPPISKKASHVTVNRR